MSIEMPTKCFSLVPSQCPGNNEEIFERVCEKHKISRKQLLERKRIPRLVIARDEAMFLLRSERGLSFPSIGRVFHKDHSTVMHGIKNHQKRNPITPPPASHTEHATPHCAPSPE